MSQCRVGWSAEIKTIEVGSTYEVDGYLFKKLKNGDILIVKDNINFKVAKKDLASVSLALELIWANKVVFKDYTRSD